MLALNCVHGYEQIAQFLQLFIDVDLNLSCPYPFDVFGIDRQRLLIDRP